MALLAVKNNIDNSDSQGQAWVRGGSLPTTALHTRGTITYSSYLRHGRLYSLIPVAGVLRPCLFHSVSQSAPAPLGEIVLISNVLFVAIIILIDVVKFIVF